VIVEHAAGLTWVERSAMARAAHALRDGERVWLVDPFEDPEALERAGALGEVAGVLQLLDRHERDGAAIAARLGVEVLRLPDALPGSRFEVLRPVDVPRWRERALVDRAAGVLVVAEVLGTVGYFRLGPGPVGVHPFLRPFGVPRALRDAAQDVLLCGHGAPVTEDAAAGVAQAAGSARTDLLLAPVRALRR
jgi:hypothetical protein